MGFVMKSTKAKGFTLIELLIVIALIGILAVALLSAINPLEQLRKGRDSARKADASELLNAIERFYASYQCYPWSFNGATSTCSVSSTQFNGDGGPRVPSWGGPGGIDSVSPLFDSGELKVAFEDRMLNSSSPSNNKLFLVERGWETDMVGQVSVCFEPESSTARRGGLGRITTIDGSSGNCTGVNYQGGELSANSTCAICVPQ